MTTTNTTPARTIKTSAKEGLKWTRHHDHDCAGRVYTALVELPITSVTGNTRVFLVALRLDGRGGTYRVDMKTMSYGPWEAVDGGEGVRTVAHARAFAQAYRKGCVAQGTLHPSRIERLDGVSPAVEAQAA